MSGNAEFGIRIKVDGGRAAAAEIDQVNAATKSVGDTAAATSAKLTDAQRTLLDSTDKLTLGQVQFLEKLQEQAETAGLSRAELLKYQAAQLGVSNQAQQYIDKIANATSATHSFSLANASTTRELLVLGREMATGNFDRLGGSMLVLANRTGLAGAAFELLTNPITLAAAAIGIFAIAATKGRDEMVAMNNAIAVTNSYAGLSRSGMESLAQSITATGEISIGTANAIVTQLVASGRIGSQAIAEVAHLASDFAKSTGKDVEQITPELVKLFADPAKGADELNQSMHFLTATQLEHIRTLQTLGQTEQAQKELADELTAHMPKQVENLGFVERAWNAVAGAIANAWQQTKNIGKDTTVDQKIAELQAKLDGVGEGSKYQSVDIKGIKAEIENLQEVKRLQNSVATASTETARANDEQTKSWDAVTKASQLYGLQQVELQKQLVEKFSPTDDKQAADKADALRRLNKEIEDGYRSIGAEGRQLAQQEAASTLQIDELRLKSQQDDIEGMTALGQMRKTEADAALRAIDLERNDAQKAYAERMLQIGGLTKTEHAAQVDKLEKLAQAEQLIKQRWDLQQQIDEKAYWDDVYKSIIAVGDAEIKRLDDAITAQKEHNAEIGKTAEEKAFVKKRIEEETTAQLESDAAFLQRALDEDEWNPKIRAAYELRLQQLQQEIAKRKELTGLISQSAVLEAEAANFARAQDEWKSVASTLESSIDDAIANGGQSALRKLKAEAVKSILQVPVQFIAGNLASLFTGTSPTGSTLLSAFGQGASAYNSVGSLGTLATNLGLDGAYNTVAGWLGATGTGLTGAAGIGAASSIGGSGLFAADAGYYGASAAADAAGAASAGASAGISSALAAVPGWGWAALGAVALGAMLGGGGESRSGGGYDVNSATGIAQYHGGPDGGQIPGATTLIEGAYKSLKDLLTSLGSTAGVWLTAGLESSTEGKGGTFAGGKINGIDFGTTSATKTYNQSLSPQEALTQLQANLEQSVVQALQAATDIPKSIADELKGVDAKSLTDQAAKDLLASITTEVNGVNQFRAALETLPDEFQNLKNLSFDAADGLIKAVGGASNLQDGLASFVNSFYSEAERMAALQTDVTKRMTDLGFASVTTEDQFRDLVKSLDLTTDAGRKTFASLLAIAPAFAQVADYAKQAEDDAAASAKQAADQAASDAAKAAQDAEQQRQQAIENARNAVADAYQRESSALQGVIDKLTSSAKALRDFRDSLSYSNLSPLSPTQKLEDLRSQISSAYSLAQAGDPDAASRLQSLSQQFLQASQSVNASSGAFVRDYEWVQSMLDKAAKAADVQADLARSQLAAMQQQVEGILDVNQSVQSLADAITSFFAAGGTRGGASGSSATGGALSYTQWLVQHPGIPQNASSLDYFTKVYGVDGSHLNGLDRVPYDGYRAELHKDEAVLTASEADQYRSSKNGQGVAEAIDRQTAAIHRQASAFERLADKIQTGQVKADENLRATLQHLSHVGSKRKVAA